MSLFKNISALWWHISPTPVRWDVRKSFSEKLGPVLRVPFSLTVDDEEGNRLRKCGMDTISHIAAAGAQLCVDNISKDRFYITATSEGTFPPWAPDHIISKSAEGLDYLRLGGELSTSLCWPPVSVCRIMCWQAELSLAGIDILRSLI